MRNYIILNGQNSNSISGLLIQSLAPISKPQMRTQTEEIDGRPGDIVTDLGFSSYDKEITIGLYGNFDINEVIAYFNSQGVVTFSNEPDKYYNYQIYDQIDFERLVRYRTATVTMHCQPFKYSTTEGADILSPTDNLISIPDFTKTTNGITVTAKDGMLTVQGTGSAATEFYVPTGGLNLPAGSYTFTATASGRGATATSVRLIKSAPSDADSFGGKYITLKNAPVSISGAISASTTYNYLWFYINPNTELNFTLTVEVEDEGNKVVSDEGTNLVLEGSAEAPFNTLDLKGNTEQQTYTGKNLLTITPYDDGSGVTGTYTDGTITLTGTCTDANKNKIFEAAGTLPAGTYTLTLEKSLPFVLNFTYGSGGQFRIPAGSTSITTTLASSMTGASLFIGLGVGTTYNQTFKIQLTAGSSPDTNFEPYVGGTASPNPDYPQAVKVVTGENVVKICGKNLFDSSAAIGKTSGGLTTTIAADGALHITGTATDTWADLTNEQTIKLENGVRYTASIASKLPCNLTFYLHDPRENVTISAGSLSSSFTADSDKKGVHLYCAGLTAGRTYDFTVEGIQIEKSSQATAYEPYQEQSYPISLGSTELRAIPNTNYKDKIVNIDGTWKIRRLVGKMSLTSTTAGLNWDSSVPRISINASSWGVNGPRDTSTAVLALSNKFVAGSFNYVYSQKNNGFAYSSSGFFSFVKKSWTTEADAKADIDGTDVYYALRSTTDETISDNNLIEQLDDIYYHAHAYKERTHVSSSAATGNVPHILAAEVVKNSDGSITNSGNYFSKPRLTIYGEGEIGVYLNGIQIFQIALGSEGYITIDTAALEAYKDTTDNLKNRLVTGDYENFALRPGENQLSFSGSVTKCIVENYSRWL